MIKSLFIVLSIYFVILFAVGLSKVIPENADANDRQFETNEKVEAQQGNDIQDEKVNSAPSDLKFGANFLIDHPDCATKLRHMCGNRKDVYLKNDLDVLSCVLDQDEELDDLNPECHHVIWSYQKNLTKNDQFHRFARQNCNKDIEKAQLECNEYLEHPGQLLSCLIENKEHITTGLCRDFISRVGSIVFTDYRLIAGFADNCENDIEQLKCGRHDTEEGLHSQGATLECLQDNLERERRLEKAIHDGNTEKQAEFDALYKISDRCQVEMFRTLEFQAEDYHLDRPLFFACKEDREKFCQQVPAGNGAVMHCLLMALPQKDMSPKCREKLIARKKLIDEDIKADKPTENVCAADIEKYKCNRKELHPEGSHSLLPVSVVIMCLEQAHRDKHPVSQQCLSALSEERRMLMDELRLTPELSIGCVNELNMCHKQFPDEPQQMAHCLMALARSEKPGKSEKISAQCSRALQDFIVETNPMEDLRVDQVLIHACQPLLKSVCAEYAPGRDSRLLGCLMDHVNAPEMKHARNCRDRLFEMVYFSVQDFRLSGQLYEDCHQDAVEKCHAPDEANKNTEPERGPLIFACLYRHAFTVSEPDRSRLPKLSPQCEASVKEELGRRSNDIMLMPEISIHCGADLGEFCATEEAHGQEFNCLRHHFERLRPNCKQALEVFTKIQQANPASLNHNLAQKCAHEIPALCPGDLHSEEALITCLITHKNDGTGMSEECANEISEVQKTAMIQVDFDPKLQEACEEEFRAHCMDDKKTGDALECLYTLAQEDYRRHAEWQQATGGRNEGMPPPLMVISPRCHQRLQNEMMQQAEDVHLDEKVAKACDKEIRKCEVDLQRSGNYIDGGRILECLRANPKKLSRQCNKVIFIREQHQAEDPNVDFLLMKNCKHSIEKICRGKEGPDIFMCLKMAKTNGELMGDDSCMRIVLKRQIEEAKDYRLNPNLAKSCKNDISKYCHKEFMEVDRKLDDLDAQTKLEGKVISCLREAALMDRLSSHCNKEISIVKQEASENYKLDAYLAAVCQEDIQRSCDHIPEKDVYECLKKQLHHSKIKDSVCQIEVARVIKESRLDIHLDALLTDACSEDLYTKCSEVKPGQGRKMLCLQSLLDKNQLNKKCRSKLMDRIELFKIASNYGAPESLLQVAQQIHQSPSSHYLLGSIFCILFVIFIGGICCGRVTKRVRREIKNR